MRNLAALSIACVVWLSVTIAHIYPVVKAHAQTRNPTMSEIAVPFDVKPLETNPHHYAELSSYSCEDKSRFLLTSEDGVKHCIRLVQP